MDLDVDSSEQSEDDEIHLDSDEGDMSLFGDTDFSAIMEVADGSRCNKLDDCPICMGKIDHVLDSYACCRCRKYFHKSCVNGEYLVDSCPYCRSSWRYMSWVSKARRKKATMVEHITSTLEYPMPEEEAGELLVRRLLLGWIQRSKFLNMRKSAKILQRYSRGFLVRLRMLRNKAAALIQKTFRGFKCRNPVFCPDCKTESHTMVSTYLECRHCKKDASHGVCYCREKCKKSWRPTIEWKSNETPLEKKRRQRNQDKHWELERRCKKNFCKKAKYKKRRINKITHRCLIHTFVNKMNALSILNKAAISIQSLFRGHSYRSRSIAQNRRNMVAKGDMSVLPINKLVELKGVYLIDTLKNNTREIIEHIGSDHRPLYQLCRAETESQIINAIEEIKPYLSKSFIEENLAELKVYAYEEFKKFLKINKIHRKLVKMEKEKYQLLSDLTKKYQAILVIQSWWKSDSVQKCFYQRKMAACLIQKVFRNFSRQRKIRRMNYEISKLNKTIAEHLKKALQATQPGARNAHPTFADMPYLCRLRKVLNQSKKICRKLGRNFDLHIHRSVGRRVRVCSVYKPSYNSIKLRASKNILIDFDEVHFSY
tara:strand:- start:2188 stop:3978 length:1791 start_codon:yes stop_codon:yes gene_type:complete